ncbi:unnamed protein product [Rotaria sp. Silwood2]|nr:unnamed protein product [Rotaria sp. Silwood2]CAF4056580.1 unnamed protein product [Rotaria sp. Silwood2]
MEPFSTNLLTILVLICLSWTGVIFIAVLILFIFLICQSCSKRRRLKSIDPIQKYPSGTSISRDADSRTITSSPTQDFDNSIDHHKKSGQHQRIHNTISVKNEHANSSYNNNKKSQQKIYTNDKNDKTTTMNEYRTFNQNYQERQYQPIEPINYFTAVQRSTPYPHDVIVREKLMHNSRLKIANHF